MTNWEKNICNSYRGFLIYKEPLEFNKKKNKNPRKISKGYKQKFHIKAM